MLNYLSKKYATDQVITKYDTAIQCNVQPSSIKPHLDLDDLFDNYCMVANVYDEGTLNEVLVEGVDPSFRHTLRNCCATNSHADRRDIAFRAELLLFIQMGSEKIPTSHYLSTNPAKPYTRKP